MTLLVCHLIAFVAGFALDLVFGDPRRFPHPVRAIGKLISVLEKRLNKPGADPAALQRAGGLMVAVVVLSTAILAAVVLVVAYLANVWAGVVVEALLTCTVLSARDLRKQSMIVCRKLLDSDLEGARYAVSMIVGRDTNVLDEAGVARAAIETVAENTADGVIAPMVYAAIGGPVLGLAYKAVNTMDSMVGYKNERFIDFGRKAALLDDAVNFVPARLAALLMVAASFVLSSFGGSVEVDADGNRADGAVGAGGAVGNKNAVGAESDGAESAGAEGADEAEGAGSHDGAAGQQVKVFSTSRAFAIFKRDRFKHKSPNSAQTESTCAGSLGVQLAGNISYFGVMNEKPTIGDDLRPVVPRDILRANQLMYGTSVICEIICAACIALAVFFTRI